jgi:YVTN family beta-propeller protein
MTVRRPHWTLSSRSLGSLVLIFVSLLLMGVLQTGPIHAAASAPRAHQGLTGPTLNSGPHAPSSSGPDLQRQPSGHHPRSVSEGSPIAAQAALPIHASTPGLTLSPTNGTIGSTVYASGSGFSPSVKISFTFDGLDLNSSCMTDSTGAFPGTSGTLCSFIVPAVPGGAEGVVATDAGLPGPSGGIPVGSSPDFEVYDSALGEIFVANGASGNVSVFSDSNDSIVASISVQSYPNGLAYDPTLGEVFVANSVSDNVSVISDSNNTVVATIAAGSQPYNCVYDSGLGEVFVTNAASDNVSVISASNDTVVGSIAVGTGPIGIVYDSALGELFVANSGSKNVSVISDSNNTVIATVSVGLSPQYLAFDPGNSEVFVTDYSSDNVSVISAASSTLVATIAVGSNPIGVAYDSAQSQVFVANINSGNVSIISDSTNSILGTTSNVNSGPYAVVADSAVGGVFVTNARGTDVNLIPVGSHASANFSINATIRFQAGSDLGQVAFVSGGGFGANLALVTLELGSTPLGCNIASYGSCVNGTVYTNSSGYFDAQITVPSSIAPGTYDLTVTDSAGNSAKQATTVFADPLVSIPTAAPSKVDLGQSTTFGVTVDFGASPYSFSWRGLPSGCSSTLSSFSCSPSSSGSYTVSAVVADSNGYVATSGRLNFTVFLDPVAEVPVPSVTSGQVDAGQSVTFHDSAVLGTGVYTSYSWSGMPGGCSGSTENVTCSGPGLPAGQYSISVTVADSNNFSSIQSGNLTFSVEQDPVASTPSATRPSLDLGQTVTFASGASFGAGPYGYAWVGLPTGCASVDSATEACTPSAAGSFNVQLRVTDSNSFTVTSAALSFVAYATPTVELTANRTAFDAGQGVTLDATVAFGSGGDTYAWSGLPTGCAGAGPTISCLPSGAGKASVQVKVNDSNGYHASSGIVVLVVSPPLAGTLTVSNQSVTVGQAVEFQANVSGGTAPVIETWSFGDGTVGSGASTNHTYSKSGDYSVVLWINDSSNGSIKRAVSVSVTSPSSASSSELTNTDILIVVLLVVVIAIVAALLLARRRRGGSDEREPSMSEPVDDSAAEPSGDEASIGDAPDSGVP